MAKAGSAEQTVREIRRRTGRRFSAEEKIRIVLEGLRGEESIAALCRLGALAPNRYYRSEGAVDRLDQRNARCRVVDARLRQGPGDDHTQPVDTEMQLLPASPPPSSMLRRGPFTLAHDREARAVDNEIQSGTKTGLCAVWLSCHTVCKTA